MSFPFKSVGNDMQDRLVRSLLVPVHKACAAQGLGPGVERLGRHLIAAAEQFTDDVGVVDLQPFHDWIAEEYPDFDLELGGNQGPAGDFEKLEAEYAAIFANELLGNYYEGNWNGEVEEIAVARISKEMLAEGVITDAHSSPENVMAAAGDEWSCEDYGDDD